jgi:hypothetical protein
VENRACGLTAAAVWFLGAFTGLAWQLDEAYVAGQYWSESVPDLQGILTKSPNGGVYLAIFGHMSTPDYTNGVIQVQNRVLFGCVDENATGPHELVAEFPYTGASRWLDACVDASNRPHLFFFQNMESNLVLKYATRPSETDVWTLSTLAGPWPTGLNVRVAAALKDGKPAVAFAVEPEGVVYWAERAPFETWAISVASPPGAEFHPPLKLDVSPGSVPVIGYMDGSNLVASYRAGGTWNQELVKAGAISTFDMRFDRFGQLALACQQGTDVFYGVRSSFGSWNLSPLLSAPSGGGELALAFSPQNTPALAFGSGRAVYYSQPLNTPEWEIAAASSCFPEDCFYSWKYVGQGADLEFDANGYPAILHGGRSGSYKVNTHTYFLYLSHFPLTRIDWSWAYHDDADGEDERTTQALPEQRGTYLDRTEFLDGEDIAIWLLTSERFQSSGGQVWMHWWNGTADLWTQAHSQGLVVVQPGEINGSPAAAPQTAALWRADISATMTQAGENYYAIQLKTTSALPNNGQWVEEGWLTRDITGGPTSATNNLGQAMTQTNDYAGHDWSVRVLADTDGDGISDDWETAQGLDPADPTDAPLDSDKDGFPNLAEFQADTHSKDSNDFFAVWSLLPSAPPEISFWSSTGRVYTLQRIDALAAGTDAPTPWVAVSGQIRVRGNGSIQGLRDASGIATSRFYRGVVEFP